MYSYSVLTTRYTVHVIVHEKISQVNICTFKDMHLCVFCMTIANGRLSGKYNLNRSGTSLGIIVIWE